MACGETKSIAFVSGNFNVVHPGHLRLLEFAAEQADVLVVEVNSDKVTGVTLPQDMHLENVRSIRMVDYAVGVDAPTDAFVEALKPNLVAKGKEFEKRFNPEQAAVESYGGRLVFGSGELRFAWVSLLKARRHFANFSTLP